MTIVLLTKGKRDDFAESVAVRVFDNYKAAEQYCKSITDLDDKYWIYAQIITEGLFTTTYKPKKHNES